MIFVDAGAFIGRHWRPDPHHAVIVRAWETLLDSGESMSTSPAVVGEVLDFFAYAAPAEFARARAQHLEAAFVANEIEMFRPTPQEESLAFKWFDRIGGKRRRKGRGKGRKVTSWTDCLSFALMESRGIERAFTVDVEDYEYAGFQVWPEREGGDPDRPPRPTSKRLPG